MFKYLGCDCYENGTKYCLKRAYDYCKCRSGYKGNKCNYFKHLAISNGPLTNNNNMDEIRDYSSNIRFHSNGNKRQGELEIDILGMSSNEFLQMTKLHVPLILKY